MKIFIWAGPNGTSHITRCLDGANKPIEQTVTDAAREFYQTEGFTLPEDFSFQEITELQIPTDRTYRNAWKIDAQKNLAVDMPTAKAIHLNRIREVRSKILPKLDADWMKAMGQKDQAAADVVEAKRQALRNLPQTLDLSAADTPEKLKAIWPQILS